MIYIPTPVPFSFVVKPNLNISSLLSISDANGSNGQIQVVIGTHALIQETVQFKQLGLVIIDEQHRFGVGQRQALVDKNDKIAVNLLQMTATPIPRSQIGRAHV